MFIGKIGQCSECKPGSPPRRLIKGKCEMHYYRQLQRISLIKKPLTRTQPKRTPLKKSFIKKSTGTLPYYEYHIEHNNWICENCGEPIIPSTEDIAYGAQAHILPKSKFSSIKNHFSNHMTLNKYSCCCHGQWDSNWYNASKMPIKNLAISRIEPLVQYLNLDELRRWNSILEILKA